METVTNLRQLTRKQVEVLLSKAEIKAKGSFVPPVLDLAAIKARADELDPKSQLKADIYQLLSALQAKE